MRRCAIQEAADPSSAIQAYARATAAGTTNVAAEQAFVHRMVSFGLPEMAETQAAELAQRMPTDGIAWAVLGYMNAKRDQLALGLSDMSMAAEMRRRTPSCCAPPGSLSPGMTPADKTQAAPQTLTTVESLRKTLERNNLS